VWYERKIFPFPLIITSNQTLQAMDEKTITVRWAIKGYRVYKIKPHENIPMTVEHEPDNSHEPNAMVVKMPDATTINNRFKIFK